MPFGRLERRARPAPFSDINMTPLIDVMLVLLVLFIVTAPLMAARLPLELPRSDSAAPSPLLSALTLDLTADGQVQVDQVALDDEAWKARLVEAAQRNPSVELHLRADTRVPYGRVAEVMAAARQAGIGRIGFAVAAHAPP